MTRLDLSSLLRLIFMNHLFYSLESRPERNFCFPGVTTVFHLCHSHALKNPFNTHEEHVSG